MKIRAITLGISLDFIYEEKITLPQFEQNLRKVLQNISGLKETFNQNGIDVQYIRLSTTPFSKSHPKYALDLKIIEILECFVKEKLLGIYAFQPALFDLKDNLTKNQIQYCELLPKRLAQYTNYFSSIQVASTTKGINFQAIKECTKIIQACSMPDPFLNLKFCVSFNVPPDTPFFPSSYHLDENPSITIALEAADEIITILTEASHQLWDLDQIRAAIHTRFGNIYDQIANIIHPFCDLHQIQFSGIDFSPAPYPSMEKSIGTALEKLQLAHFGEFGSVFGVGFLTQALQSVPRPKIGFSGFMQPVLEDAMIGLRSNEGKVDISKLMLFSTMCGLGLDCIPLPGDADANTISLLLMDIAMIACRLNKPLTARLMPIPNKTQGDSTSFNFEFFTNSKILDFPASHPDDLFKFIEKNPFYHL
jgi:uncharacterized protein (UPF0210 family)